ncbi:hypothetical protein B7463_g7216, partial [Scytalidium lignicola]
MTGNYTVSESGIPIFLLKTRSSPTDGYEAFFSAPNGELKFKPTFVPVLEHKFLDDGLETVGKLLKGRQFGRDSNSRYGGLIFTSQRAVEAFAKLYQEIVVPDDESNNSPHLHDVPIYTVGPATTRALRAISPSLKPLRRRNGKWRSSSTFNTGPLCRMVSISGTEASATISNRRIQVDELVVYGTGVMESFEQDFTQRLEETSLCNERWVVVFSPTGCEAMLRSLGLLDPVTGKVKTSDMRTKASSSSENRRVYIATIGPTTRDHLKKNFGYEPDVCAEKPSPEGIMTGIQKFLEQNKYH